MPRTRKDEAPLLLDEPELTGRYVELDGYTVCFESYHTDTDPAPFFRVCPTIAANARTGGSWSPGSWWCTTRIAPRCSPVAMRITSRPDTFPPVHRHRDRRVQPD